MKIRILITLLAVVSCSAVRATTASAQSKLRFEISFPAVSSAKPFDGRMLLLIANNNTREPRLQISEDPTTQQVFGIDVDGLKPGDTATVDDGAFGYPVRSISELKPGEYHVQALLHVYETFRRADGHTVKLPMDRGEGQQWSRAPGNFYSTPREVALDPRRDAVARVALDRTIPPIPEPPATKYVRHERILSEPLTKFLGRPMHLGAHDLLPLGWEEHPEARYPLVVFHGHFPSTIGGWREEPPDPDLQCEYSERFGIDCYNRI